MKTLEETLFAALGPLCATRVYPLSAPDLVARPYAVFSTLSAPGIYTLQGPAKLRRAEVEVTVYDDDSKSYESFNLLSTNVNDALESVGGQLADESRTREPATRLRVARFVVQLWTRYL